jgi:hypothetical protein
MVWCQRRTGTARCGWGDGCCGEAIVSNFGNNRTEGVSDHQPMDPGLTGGWKVMLHHLLPNTEDHPLHDHPWSFFTIVLWGSYEDIGYSDEVVQARRSVTAQRDASAPD